jgi:hypothetical protein
MKQPEKFDNESWGRFLTSFVINYIIIIIGVQEDLSVG